MTRNRLAKKGEQVHNAAIKRALARKQEREFLRANGGLVEEDEDQEEAGKNSTASDDSKKSNGKTEFYDVCAQVVNETAKEKEKVSI